MKHVDIRILAVGDPAPWPQPKIREGEINRMAILENGMQSGAVSVVLMVDVSGLEQPITVQLSGNMLLSMAGAVRGAKERFGDKS